MVYVVDGIALILMFAATGGVIFKAVSIWWNHGWRMTIERLSSSLWEPFLAVTMSLFICYPFSVDRYLAAAQIVFWVLYLEVYCLVRLVRRRFVLVFLNSLGWIVAIVCLAEVIVTGNRAGMWIQDNANKAGGLLAVLLPLWENGLWLFGGGAALLLTGSRGAIMGVVASYVANFVRRVKDEWMVGFIAVSLVTVLILLGMMRPTTIKNRWHTWQEAAGLFAERPLTGWGPGCYTRLAVYEPEHPHADNWPLTIAAEMGLVGLAAWGYLVIEVVKLARWSSSRARLGLLVFAVHNLVDCMLWWPWVGIVVVACVALLEGEK